MCQGLFCHQKTVQAARGSCLLPCQPGGNTVAQQICRAPVWQRTSCKLSAPSVKPIERAWEFFFFKAYLGRTISHHRDWLWKRFSKQLKWFLCFTVNPFWELFLDKVCYRLGCSSEVSSNNHCDWCLGQKLCHLPQPWTCLLNSLSF